MVVTPNHHLTRWCSIPRVWLKKESGSRPWVSFSDPLEVPSFVGPGTWRNHPPKPLVFLYNGMFLSPCLGGRHCHGQTRWFGFDYSSVRWKIRCTESGAMKCEFWIGCSRVLKVCQQQHHHGHHIHSIPDGYSSQHTDHTAFFAVKMISNSSLIIRITDTI